MTASAGSVSVATLEEGRHIFTRQCTSCHTADPVAKFSPAEWKAIVVDMAERSEIDERQQAAVIAYILAARTSVLARPGS
jgi:mono/diheme cytochrome c family protein